MADATTAVITGTVIDGTTKRPMPQVIVEVESAATGDQVVVTDSSGSYRIPNLAPGAYTIRVATDGYNPAGTSVKLNANQTIRADIQLAPLAVQAAEIVVIGKAPTVDVGTSQTGVVVTKDFSSRVALSRPGGKGGAARSFESVAEVAPGAKNDTYGVSINGTTSPENAYIIDGLSVSNPAYGIVGTPLSVDFVREVSVISGGYMPEYGRSTGGVLNVVTKSGGNEFHGSAFLNFSPGSLEGTRTRVRAAGQTISTDRNVDLIHDFGAELGGPILKDKLWFYGGLSFNSSRYRVEQNLNRRKIDPSTPLTDDSPNANPHPEIGYDFVYDDNGDPVVERIPGTTSVRPAIERGMQYIGKLTFAVSPDHQLELSIYGAPSTGGGEGAWGIDPQDGSVEGAAGDYSFWSHRYVSEANDISLKWSGAFDNKTLLIDASAGWHHQRSARLPADGSALGSKTGDAGRPSVLWQKFDPYVHDIRDFRRVPGGAATCAAPISVGVDADKDPDVDSDGDGIANNDNDATVSRDFQCPATTYESGGPDYIDDSVLDRYHAKITATKLFHNAKSLGHHVVKAGIDFEQMSYDHTKGYSGGVRFAENGSGTAFNEQRQYGFLTGPDTAVLQPTQRAGSTSTSVGAFVQDSWNVMDVVTLNLGIRYDSQYMFGNDGKLGMALPTQFAPRVGVIYDITQQGRSKIYASFARYYESIPLDIVDRGFPGDSEVGSRHRSKTDPGAGEGPAVGLPEGERNYCDPGDLEQAVTTCREEQSRVSRGRVFGTSYDPHQKWFATGNSKVPVDPNLQPQASDEIIIGGEFEVVPDGRIGAQYTHRYMVSIIEDMSRDEATTYFIGNPGSGIAKDFPKGQRDYDGVSLFFTKSFSDKWLAQVSYTLSFLRGNIAGLYRSETGQLDPNANSDFDLKSLTINRYGALPGDNTHEIKVYAARDIPFNEFFDGPNNMQLNIGLGYNGTSGGPTSFLGAHAIYGTSEMQILPRGTGDRLPFVHRLDGHFQYDVKFTSAAAFSVYMDVFNLFNFQEVTLTDEDYTFGEVAPIVDGKPVRNATTGRLEPNPAQLKHPDGTDFDVAVEKNPNFGKPIRYQSPRTFRFGARVSF